MSKKDFTVIVTGFGANLNAPYGNNTSNPSSLIAQILPPSLPPSHPFNPTGKVQINMLDAITGDFAAIHGSYGTIRRRIAQLHQEHPNVDLWIHLGRGPWDFVTCERRAFRQDFTSSWLGEGALKGYYYTPDNDQQTAHDLGPCPWSNVPIGLDSELDINAIVEAANQPLPQDDASLEVRSHVEAGNAGCGFAFYESLANCYVAGRKRHVLFCHVPRHTEKVEIEKARDVILAIIGASVASIIAREDKGIEDWKQSFGLVP